MPYIDQQDRELYDNQINAIVEDLSSIIKSSKIKGELNYVISSIVTRLINKNLCYSSINDVIGVIECAKLEFYRKVVSPYEDKKISDNGDIV